MNIEEFKQLTYGSVIKDTRRGDYLVLLGFSVVTVNYVTYVRINEKKLNEKDLLKEVKSCTSIKSLLEFFTTQEFHLVKELNFLNFVMKTKLTGINKNDYYVEEVVPFYILMHVITDIKEFSPLESYEITFRDGNTTDFAYIYNDEGIVFVNNTFKVIKLTGEEFIARKNYGINPNIYSHGEITIGSIINFATYTCIVLKRHYTKFLIACISTGNALSLQGCYSIRKVVKKSELEMGRVRTDAYSQELIKLMMKYDEQLKGIFQK